MPISAKFAADFEDFYAAVQKSEVALRSFQSGAGTVEKSLNKMADSFSGRSIIQQATLAAKAIEDIGGVTKLTAAEQDRANKIVDQAVQKFEALGQTAPAGILALRDSLQGASEATGGWLPLLKEMGNSWVARVAEGVLLRDAIHEVFGVIKEVALALPEIALKGAGIADVEENFKHLTDQAGLLGDKLLGTLRAGTHNTITDFELMKTVNKDLTAGLNLTDAQFGTLTKGAFALAQATGTDVKTALDTMNDAMLTGRTRALALLTGKIDVTKAEENFAKSLGTTAEHLSEAGKLEANRAAILDAVAGATKRLGDQTDGLDERVAQAQTAWANFTENLGKTIATSKVLGAGMDAVAKALADGFGGSQQALIEGIVKQVDQAAIATLQFAQAGAQALAFIGTEFSAVKIVFGNLLTVIDGVRLAVLLARQAATTGILPGQVDVGKWKELDDQIQHLAITMKLRDEGLNRDKAAQADWNTIGDKTAAAIQAIIDKMLKAQQAGSDYRKALDDSSHSQTQAGQSAGQHAGLLKQSAEEMAKAKAAAEKLAEAQKEIASAGSSWVDTLNRMDTLGTQWGLHLLSQGVSLKSVKEQLGLTDTQAKALQEQYDFLNKGLEATNKAFDVHNRILGPITARYSSLHSQVTGLDDVTGNLSATVYDFANTAAPSTIDALGRMGFTTEELRKKLHDLRLETVTVGDSIKEALEKIPDILIKAFEGGGDLAGAFKAIGVQLADAILEPILKGLSKAQQLAVTAGAGITGALAGAGGLGTATTSIIGVGTSLAGAAIAAHAAASGIGAFAAGSASATVAAGALTLGIGAAAVGVALLVKHWLSVSQAEKDARAAFDTFGKALGTSNVDEFIARVGAAYAKLGKSGVEAQQDIQRALDATHISAQAEAAALQKIAAVVDEADKKTAAFNAALQSVQQNGASNFNAMAVALQGDQASLAALGAQALTTYATLVAGGASTTAALTAIAPGLDALKQSYVDLGLDINGAGIAALLMQASILKANPQVIAGIDALGSSMKDLDGLGLLNVSTFQDMEKTGLAMYTRLQAAVSSTGGTTQDALLPMQGYLHEAADEAEKLGIPLDANTQLLIDQSKELGIWKDAGESSTQLVTDAMNALVDSVKELINQLKGIPTDIHTNVTVTTTNVTAPDNSQGLAAGGVIHAARGIVLPFPGRPSGIDTVPIWAAKGEAVLNRNATARLGEDAINRLNAGGWIGGQVVQFSTAALEDKLDRLRDEQARRDRELPHTLARALRDAKALAV
jgi:hypothetical protein